MSWAGAAPWKGDTVRVLWTGGEPTAFPVYGSGMGTVQSVSGNLARVTGDDGVAYRWPFAFGLALSNGHRVALDHAHQLIVARYSQEPPASEYSASGGGGGAKSAVFSATDSGRWNVDSGAFRDQRIRADDDNSSAIFFGTQIADSVAGGTFTRLELRLLKTYDNVPGTATTLGYHDYANRPGSMPPLGGGIEVTGGAVGAVTVVNIMTWAASFAAGSTRGVGFYGNEGWREFGDFSTSSIYGEWS